VFKKQHRQGLPFSLSARAQPAFSETRAIFMFLPNFFG